MVSAFGPGWHWCKRPPRYRGPKAKAIGSSEDFAAKIAVRRRRSGGQAPAIDRLPNRSRRHALAWTDFPPNFRADAEACLKRLENGRFLWPAPAEGAVAITPAQLAYLKLMIATLPHERSVPR